jgi:hypothetical protein
VKMAARLALKWIEECMVKMPFWIHVQSSSETLPVQITPPPLSPSLNRWLNDLPNGNKSPHLFQGLSLFMMPNSSCATHHVHIIILYSSLLQGKLNKCFIHTNHVYINQFNHVSLLILVMCISTVCFECIFLCRIVW